ncbi:MAG: hypothetical protein KC609_20450, partial [Myxococcales bacterium]|nr:hypothetical protein [Myxococcales bacterium]
FVPALRRKHVYLSALKPVFGLTYGMPTEATMPSVEWSVGQLSNGRNPDLGSAGILYCLPIIPMEGVAVRELIAMIDETLTHGGFVPYVTFNMVNRQSLECVINIAFDRRDVEESERAHAAIDRLFERCMSEGLIPYRVGIQHMRRLVDVGDPHWQLVRKLKEVFDPDGVIAPGRYNLA